MEILRDSDTFQWGQVGLSVPREKAKEAHHIARYLRFVRDLKGMHEVVQRYPRKGLMELDTLTLVHRTLFWGGDWTMNPMIMDQVQPTTTRARRMIELTAAKHYCQTTDDGCLGLTSGLIIMPEMKKDLKSLRIHLTNMDAPPPFVWGFPVSWTYDSDEYAYNENGCNEQWNHVQRGIDQAVQIPLSFRKQGTVPGPSMSRAPASITSLKKLDLTVYASPYNRVRGHPLSKDRKNIDRESAHTIVGHRAFAAAGEQNMKRSAALGKQDKFSWKAAPGAPACPACDLTACGALGDYDNYAWGSQSEGDADSDQSESADESAKEYLTEFDYGFTGPNGYSHFSMGNVPLGGGFGGGSSSGGGASLSWQ